MTTKEEADTNLRQAITDHAEAYGLNAEEGEMLSDFAVVASWIPRVSNGRTNYTQHFHMEEIPTHVAAGLWKTALHHLLNDSEE